MRPPTKAEMARHQAGAEDTLANSKYMTLQSADDYRCAVGICAGVKRQIEKLEAVKEGWTGPLASRLQVLRDLFRGPLDVLLAAERVLKEKISTWSSSRPADEVPTISGLTFREQWDGAVVDASAIPRDYLVPDLVALRAVTRARGADPEIPGWQAAPVRVASVSSKIRIGK